jgi:hypothetical protein
MTKQQMKVKQLNETMDIALAGATAGLIELDRLITYTLKQTASNVKLDALHESLERRANLQRTIELLARPVTQKKDGTLYYTGGNR